jgi:hypothetical protein
MDDFLILGPDKKTLHQAKERIKVFLGDQLKLQLHPKKADIFPIDRGVDFLGYVVKGGKRYLRKSTVKRFMKRTRYHGAMVGNGKRTEMSLQNTRASWRGYAKFVNSYRLMRKLGLDYRSRKTAPAPKGASPKIDSTPFLSCQVGLTLQEETECSRSQFATSRWGGPASGDGVH